MKRIGERMKVKFCVTVLLTCVALAGCADQPRIVDVPVSKAKSLDADPANGVAVEGRKAGPYETTVGGYKFTVPAGWSEQPRKSDFVLGEFSIPGGGGAARLTLSSAGGGVEANIERWRGQFQQGPKDDEPRESTITFDGKPGTLIELHGSFTDMGSPTPKKDSRMLGVAVPIDGTNFFVKMTGPSSTITERRDEFVKFVESARMAK